MNKVDNNERHIQQNSSEMEHHKRLAQILRFIAKMQLNSGNEITGLSFVHDMKHKKEAAEAPDFCQYDTTSLEPNGNVLHAGSIICTTNDFRGLVVMQDADDPLEPLFHEPPFSFYAANENTHFSMSTGRKRLFSGSSKTPLGSTHSKDKSCWLRIKRLPITQIPAPPESSSPAVKKYCNDWMEKHASKTTRSQTSFTRFITLDRLEQAPKIPPTMSARETMEINSFLSKYKKCLRVRTFHQTLEPIYNNLFDRTQHQQGNDEDLIWGLGHARLLLSIADKLLFVNGPLLEVHVEVELMPDGALIVRPRQHSGVTLNQQVASALSQNASSSTLSQLHQFVADLETSLLSPGQPETYKALLKKIAVQMSPGGSFQLSETVRLKAKTLLHGHDRLIVTEDWCLFLRRKPTSTWARDANAFADQLMFLDDGVSKPLELPLATWSLTYGPGVLESKINLKQARVKSYDKTENGWIDWLRLQMFSQDATKHKNIDALPSIFPLPSSDAQRQIADLLLKKNYPAVVVEGPPGTGKSQAVANLICACLSQGKKVLVTSKNGPALSVLRNRLPPTVIDLCVDVSASELSGMRQLQRTIERLADQVYCADTSMRTFECQNLQRKHEKLEKERGMLDVLIRQQSEQILSVFRQPDGKKFKEIAVSLNQEAPWAMSTLGKGVYDSMFSLLNCVQAMIHDKSYSVSGYSFPIAQGIITQVRSLTGALRSLVSNYTSEAIAALPFIGSLSGMAQHVLQVKHSISILRIDGAVPSTKYDWILIEKAFVHIQLYHRLKTQLEPFGLPDTDLSDKHQLCKLESVLSKATECEKLALNLKISGVVDNNLKREVMWTMRSKVTCEMQCIAEQLVNVKVLLHLAESFSPEAQSSLIRFSQIAGKAKYNRTQPSKMTQRQHRRRQEYLDAFSQCCRFIPCWIMTTSQISEFLPPECLFDLMIVDEASQSDATIIPGMLRAKQWCIVGDRHQVSPTESFVSEESIENLRAALPPSPLQNALLPGQSFFDLCSQAFPRGRVILTEHFRCAEEIICFSNEHFYDNKLVPLRLPTRSERFSPALLDVKVHNGKKIGKVNAREADEIVRLITRIVVEPAGLQPRTIGIISLIGDEQSRLIRGKLLDGIGPEKMSLHNILIGDPPSFQGAERDIIFLSMVCSKGCVPTQSQLMHYQRANVALSRARDRCVLVRSLDYADVPNKDDVKLLIIEFFQKLETDSISKLPHEIATSAVQGQVVLLIEQYLTSRCYIVRGMGMVWPYALCVESFDSDMRAGILVDCECESFKQWNSNYLQQMAIERVGWKCFRVDALSVLVNFQIVIHSVIQFLADAGVVEPFCSNHLQIEDAEDSAVIALPLVRVDSEIEPNHVPPNNDPEVISISDEEIECLSPLIKKRRVRKFSNIDFSDDDFDGAAKFGNIVDLEFLRQVKKDDSLCNSAVDTNHDDAINEFDGNLSIDDSLSL